MKQEVLTSAQYRALYAPKALLPPTKAVKSLKGRPSLKEPPVMDSIEKGEGWCRVVLAGLSPGLNGKMGLMKLHWSLGEKMKKEYMWRIAALKPTKFEVPVIINYKRFCAKLHDSDNCMASFKRLGDALKLNRVIVNDSPEWLTLVVEQEKCRRKDQRMELTLKPL